MPMYVITRPQQLFAPNFPPAPGTLSPALASAPSASSVSSDPCAQCGRDGRGGRLPFRSPEHGTCVTIGNFDGVHVGHRALIQTMLDKGRVHDMPGVVVTFWPHPLAVLAGRHAPPQITGQMERRRLLDTLGVDLMLEMPFDRTLAALTPLEFVEAVLVPLRCRHLVIGYDFSLGKGRAGNSDVLAQLGTTHGFDVEQLGPVIVNGAVASSTRVRDLVRAGDVWELQAVLGRFYHLSGTVVHGFARGTGLGFPTANLCMSEGMLPKPGVYATWVTRTPASHSAGDGGKGQEPRVYPGVTNVGKAPTFGNAEVSVETFLLDTDEDLYGQELTLHFVQRLRDEQRFESVDALKERIARDVALAGGVLESAARP